MTPAEWLENEFSILTQARIIYPWEIPDPAAGMFSLKGPWSFAAASWPRPLIADDLDFGLSETRNININAFREGTAWMEGIR